MNESELNKYLKKINEKIEFNNDNLDLLRQLIIFGIYPLGIATMAMLLLLVINSFI